MLVQRRKRAIRLIRQHDHALVSGALAHAWRREGAASAVSFELALAVALHDVAWIPLDRRPRLHAATGRPADFQDYPLGAKLDAYREGLDRLEVLHPLASLLGSLHYAAFVRDEGPEAAAARAFLEGERRRRSRLSASVPADSATEEACLAGGLPLQEALELLRFFDRLSLLVCLSAPGSSSEARPAWLEPLDRVEEPGGRELGLAWAGEGHLLVKPFPLRSPLAVRIPYRDLPPGPFGGEEALGRAWKSAPERSWRLEVRPG